MKILIILATFVPSLDGPAFLDVNEVVDVEPDTAKNVVIAGKALFVDKKDDFTAHKQKTATDAQLDVAKKAQAEAKRLAKAAAEPKAE